MKGLQHANKVEPYSRRARRRLVIAGQRGMAGLSIRQLKAQQADLPGLLGMLGG